MNGETNRGQTTVCHNSDRKQCLIGVEKAIPNRAFGSAAIGYVVAARGLGRFTLLVTAEDVLAHGPQPGESN